MNEGSNSSGKHGGQTPSTPKDAATAAGHGSRRV